MEPRPRGTSLHHLHPTQREVLRVLLGEAERADGAEASRHLAARNRARGDGCIHGG
jgi:hypothetical protein